MSVSITTTIHRDPAHARVALTRRRHVGGGRVGVAKGHGREVRDADVLRRVEVRPAAGDALVHADDDQVERDAYDGRDLRRWRGVG